MMVDEILTLPLSIQCSGFIGSLMLGAALSFVFSLLKTTRLIFSPGTLTVAIEDILYCVSASAAVFAFLMKYSYGRLRWYIFAGVLLGWIIFKLVAGDIIAVVLSRLFRLAFGIIKAILNLIFTPFKVIFGSILEKSTYFTEKIYIFAKKVCYKCKFRLKKCMVPLYNFLYTAFYPMGKIKGKGCERRGKKKKTQKQFFC